MKNKKRKILSFLRKNGRSSTSKVAVAIQSNNWMAEKYLMALKEEGKITKEVETRGTYWCLK